ncbi:uncharacterized protein BO97DRAFT_357954, partial [Aspergillus homomorphus CBS 101889]
DKAHKGLSLRKDDFNQFYSCYQKCLGASIPSKYLPRPPRCFELQFVIEHYGKDLDNSVSTTSGHVSPNLRTHPVFPDESVQPVPIYYDRQARGHSHHIIIECLQSLEHLQELHDAIVESKICGFISQMDNWLSGTLPRVKDESSDSGIIVPSIDIDIPLIPLRNLIYEGVGKYSLIRTSKDVITPHNIIKAVYTILRIESTNLIGDSRVTVGKSIWVEHPTTLSKGLVLVVSIAPRVTVGQKA